VREHPDGTVVLVLGILGIVACGVLAPIAWVKGGRVRHEMAAQPHVTWTNRSAVNAGWICGIIGTVMVALVVLGLVLVLVAVAAASGT
jgi:uncharacterized membrane protein YjgN (DUF898 family)